MMPIIESLTHVLIALAAYLHWRNRPWVQHIGRKVVTDHRLGKIGAPKHFDSPTKNCFDYGCTNDCPIGGRK